ncbi:hypothetical protein SmJEL517_g03387 [Synchytrium microbalum]|uniref:Uncharacterized protein n=1 Tax=Synchytrium microbalum TaxID=1806994 RepID=A0A507C8Q5_9FUNG|nr:uncharacterized protein SmJEL517_g03387 [Synchytrium microbalum]TPX33913.1 hypothetical protein SmJEL517_g03387 [Synchytrium microbalum]
MSQLQDWWSLARVRILLVPIGPIRRDTFAKYVDIFNQFGVLSLVDLTPPDPKSFSNRFTESLFHEGLMYFNFVTTYNQEHAPLEEFELQKQVMGIIGIMHCQQAPVFSEGSRKFQQVLARYPGCLASRLFAFEPSENQADDTKGIIMIPNVGDVSFYLNTMMSDFSSEILKAFGNMAAHFEKKQLIVAPNMVLAVLQPESPGGNSVNSMQNSPMPERPTTPNVLTLSRPPSAHVLLSDKTSGLDQTNSSATAFGAALGSVGAAMGSLLVADKNKRRTPGRVLKLIGDIYLMAGRLDYALQNFVTCIDLMKATGDYQWHAAALDSFYCATLLSSVNKAGIGPMSAASPEQSPAREGRRGPKLLSLPSIEDIFEQAAIPNSTIRSLLCELPEKYREIVSLHEKTMTKDTQGFYPIFQVTACLKMARLLAAMIKYHFTGSIFNGAAMPITVAESRGLSDIAASINVTRPVTGSVRIQQTASESAGTQQVDRERIILNNGLGASRVDVSSWLTKTSTLGLEYLTFSDQIWVSTVIASIFGQIGYKRKHAMYLRQAGLLVLTTLKGNLGIRRLSGLYEVMGPAGPLNSPDVTFRQQSTANSNIVTSNGALECMKRVCDIMGVGEIRPKDDREVDDDELDDWMEDYEDRHDVDMFLSQGHDAIKGLKMPVRMAQRLRHGWPDLQIQVLKECVDIADASSDYQGSIIFTTRLLRRLHYFLSKTEQLELASSLESIVRRTRTEGDDTAGKTVAPLALVKNVMGGICGVPVLRSIEVVRQTPRRVPYRHTRSEIIPTSPIDRANRDPFITNAWKGNPDESNKRQVLETILVTGEMAYFDVVLANPFAFDLDIESITVTAHGIEFLTVPLSTTIPAYERIHMLRLSGIPKSDGLLHILGCTVKLFNGSVEEDIRPVGHNSSLKSSASRKHKQNDRERLGKVIPPSNKQESGRKTPIDPISSNEIRISVIPPQPLLSASSAMLGSHGSLALYEGEASTIVFKLQNISATVPIDYLTIAFTETSLASPRADAVEDPEITYERDVHDRSLRVFWLEGGELTKSGLGCPIGDTVVETVAVNLVPGESREVVIGVYGKRTCSGGSLRFNYGQVISLLSPSDGIVSLPTASPSDAESNFYTRELVVPVLLTVHRTLEALSLDVLLMGGLGPVEPSASTKITVNRSLSLEDLVTDPVGISEEEKAVGVIPADQRNEYALITFDLRNSSTAVFEVTFDLYADEEKSDVVEKGFQVTTVVHAHQTKRIVLPIKRIYLSEAVAHQPIPFPDWRQFVRTQRPKFSEWEEHIRRALFWYKEELVGGLEGRGRVVGRWLTSKGRQGNFSLRNVYLTPPMLSSLQREQVSFQARVIPLEGSTQTIRTISSARYVCPVRECVVLEWTVTNRMEHPAKFLLRIQGVQDHQNGTFETDITDTQLMYGGSLEYVFPMLAAMGGSSIYRLPCIFRGCGEYRFLYHVENRYIPEKTNGATAATSTMATNKRVDEIAFWGPEPLVVFVEK